ncbi:MAG: hypothetical protein ACOYOK_11500 [Pseudobdellovibrionaceae bacterium]
MFKLLALLALTFLCFFVPMANATASCVECDVNPSAKLYELCDDSNNYLVSQIAELGPDSLITRLAMQPADTSQFNPVCSAIVMKDIIGDNTSNFAGNTSFVKSCTEKKIRKKNKIDFERGKRPCIDQQYHQLVHNSLSLINKCLIDFVSGPGASAEVKNIYSEAMLFTMAHESGLHLNALSPSNGGGIGQLTEPAIEEADLEQVLLDDKKSRISYIEWMKWHLNKHQDPACKNLGVFLQDKNIPKEQSCKRTSLQNGNPLSNLLYSYAYIAAMKNQYADPQIFNNKQIKNKLQNLSDKQKAQIESTIITWGHRLGPAIMATAAKGTIMYDIRIFENKDKNILPKFIEKMSYRLKTMQRAYPFINEEAQSYIQNVVNDKKNTYNKLDLMGWKSCTHP